MFPALSQAESLGVVLVALTKATIINNFNNKIFLIFNDYGFLLIYKSLSIKVKMHVC